MIGTHIVKLLVLDTNQNIVFVFNMLSGERINAHWDSYYIETTASKG